MANSAAPYSELDELKGLFLASLNHEIRTPLSGILGMTDLLLETKLDEEQRDYVNAARLCAENLFEILNAVLEYSSLEAGHLELDESEFCLKELLDAAVQQYSLRAQSKGLRLLSTLDAALPETIIGDAPRLRELLGYLIANAIKFTHSGTVELRASFGARTGADRLVVEVMDTGIGIPADRLEMIFESFRQVDGGLSRNYPGLGLGLSLARKLAEMMRGEIAVSSVIGQGSNFILRLPLRAPNAAPERQEAPARDEGWPSILVVEDNPIGLAVLRHSLKQRPVQVDFATSGLGALDAAGSRRYDLVLMDLQMPDMDGLQCTLAMRKLPGYAEVPVLALTANSPDEVRERCRAAGMQAFLSKPIESAELWSTISKFLKSKV